MLFHVGCLWRLNELGRLPDIRHVSSVAAGAITAGALALAWRGLRFDSLGVAHDFEDGLVRPLRSLASETLDGWCVFGSAFSPMSGAAILADAFDQYLFKGSVLEDMPEDQDGAAPRFIFSATNLQSGALFSFSRSRVWDGRHGDFPAARLRVAFAVAASSALVPMFSPLPLQDQQRGNAAPQGHDGDGSTRYTALLTDGAVLDPLALEEVSTCSTAPFVCDGGESVPDTVPKIEWFEHIARVLTLMHEQARSRQRAKLLDALPRPNTHALNLSGGAYCSIDAPQGMHANEGIVGSMSMPTATAITRYEAMDAGCQEELINRGYGVCDAAIRRWNPRSEVARAHLPYAADVVTLDAGHTHAAAPRTDHIPNAGAVQCPPA